ncbi:MAG TPA: FtsQ-type POTRA domain-containing protein, partial [Anaerolineaceae bacterium]|nr:FtsQ-type POTRA domain-containing protein [Anaerolineaceae bacterium]
MKLIQSLPKTSRPAKDASRSTAESTPRSSQVRDRRVTTSQARVHAAVRQAANPVVRRSVPLTPGFRAQPLMKRTQSKVRRQFSIALGADSAHIVLPSLPFVRPGWQTLSAILVVAFLAAIIFMTSSDTFRVESLTINGAQRLQSADLMAVLGVSGDPVFALDPVDMTNKLQQSFPELSSIQISIGLPNQVTLDVVERQPVFEWIYGNTTLWIDLDGAVFLPRGVATLAVTVVADVPPPMVLVEEAPVKMDGVEGALVATAQPQLLYGPLAGYDPALRRVDKDVLLAAASLTLKKPAESPLVFHQAEGFGWQD